MKIKVTQKHIDAGKAEDCPVALAMRDSGLVQPDVGQDDIRWQKGAHQEWCITPAKVYVFIMRFDDGRSVRPFEFELDA